MFGAPQVRSKPPVKRTVWANDTKSVLDTLDYNRRRLEEEVELAKSKCNHTNPDGTSMLVDGYNDDGPGPSSYTYCSVCGTSL